MDKINLCELLRGHEGEIFYTTIYGYAALNSITKDSCQFTSINTRVTFLLHDDGAFDYEGECVVFPEMNQRDWNKWQPKLPKTWNELINERSFTGNPKNLSCTIISRISKKGIMDVSKTEYDTPAEKSALAFLKIHQLIERGYGGNITNEEWESNSVMHKFNIYPGGKGFIINHVFDPIYFSHIAFHTHQQAEEFLSYPENVELLKDYFMLKD